MHRILWVTLAIIGSMLVYAGTQLQATTTNPPTITLEKSVHFLTPSGDDVVIEAGTYEVEAAEEWLRMIPQGEDRGKAVLLAASRSPHGMEVATPEVRSIQTGEEEEMLWLLLPDGQSWFAKGSYNGVRTRQVAYTVKDYAVDYGVEYDGPILWDSRTHFGQIGLNDRVSFMVCIAYAVQNAPLDAVGAWTWDPKTERCRVFSSITATIPNTAVVSGIVTSYSDSGGDGSPYEMTVFYLDKFAPQGGYRQVQGTLRNCKAECKKDFPCNRFSWNKQTKTCYLRSGPGDFSDHDSYISGRKGFTFDFFYPYIINDLSVKQTKKIFPSAFR